jgi:hypothetical protein
MDVPSSNPGARVPKDALPPQAEAEAEAARRYHAPLKPLAGGKRRFVN